MLDSAIWLAKVLERCPSITLLCTSRTRIDTAGEHVVRIPPLDRESAIELFGQRARKIDGTFDSSGKHATIIAGICDRLDGLPLAIELAAARVPVSTRQSLLELLLDRRLFELSGGRRDAPDRHRGMRHAIAWSHDLVNPGEQVLFRRLAVFVDNFRLEAAGAVAGNGDDVMEGIASLQASRLLNLVSGTGAEPRFVMLETIREYALERLNKSGEGSSIHRFHAAYYVDLADQTERIWWLPEGLAKLDRLEGEFGDIRAAFAWLDQLGEVETSLPMAGSLGPLWAVRGYSREGRTILERGLDEAREVSTDVTIIALRALSWILNQHGVAERALATAVQAFELSQQKKDPQNIVGSLILSGVAAFRCGLVERAIDYQTRALAEME